ncbi:tRNA pseudouridine(38-40) synthase TruA [Mycoplasma sp. P36-A1]|uniref:tRNA pseudouridine(38-40) synthase TruA n=1 Tax=Mycoplasma sp. P36-A1 TaxID=3252900 RepID=UPI003C2CA3C6
MKIRDQKRAKQLKEKREVRAQQQCLSSSFVYELIVAYDGYEYGGFARQKHKNTIQNILDAAISKYLKIDVKTTEASRTDAKVNALAQHVMITTKNQINVKEFKSFVNENLPNDIVVKQINQKNEKFHVRYGVKDKTYEYLISKNDDIRFVKKSWYITKKLDIIKMMEAANVLIGKHDFKNFCGSKATSTTSIRTINSIKIQEDDYFIKIIINADGFLYNMVRLITAHLVDVATSKITIDNTKLLLTLENKPSNLESAPAKGLTLLEINY